MKKFWFAAGLLLWVMLLLGGCQQGDGSSLLEDQEEKLQGTQENSSAAIFAGKVMAAEEDGLTLSGKIGQTSYLISLATEDLKLTGLDGGSLSSDQIKPGMLVEVSYDGNVLEVFPSLLSHPTALQVTGQEDDMVGLYLNVLEELWRRDEGLNSGISQLAFDLTKASNLSQEEKSAFIWLAGNRYGLESYPSTFAELEEQGAIVDLYWEEGLLITFEDQPVENDRFSFQAEKWRSGLGAYFFSQCTAQKSAGTWDYTVEEEAIS